MVVAALTAVLALGGCGAVAGGAAGQAVERGGDPAADRAVRTLSAAEVEANAKVRLPPGTVLLSTSFQSALDWHLTAMFRFPADELPSSWPTAVFHSRSRACGRFATPPIRQVTPGALTVR